MAANALTVVSGRSVGLPALNPDRLTDLRNVRIEVEPIAAGWAAERRTEAELAVAKRHLQTLERVVAAGDGKAYVGANYAFHFAIYRAARSENILRITENLWLQISPYFNSLGGFYSTSNAHHRDMFAALADGDAEAIRAAVRADIDLGLSRPDRAAAGLSLPRLGQRCARSALDRIRRSGPAPPASAGRDR